MKKYLSYFKTNFYAESAYKADFFIDIASSIVFFFVFYFIWTSVYQNGNISNIGTFSLSATITYYFITSLIYRMEPGEYMYLNNEIWNGWLTNEIIRPYSARLIYVISALAPMSVIMLLYLPVAAVMIIFASQYIVLPSLLMFALFLVSLALGFLLSMSMNLIIHTLCFFYGDQGSNITLLNYIISILGGGIFPLSFLPAKVFAIINFLPFKFLFFVPANVFLGKMGVSEILYSWLNVSVWIITFFAIYYFLFQKGLKNYTATGR